MNKNILNIGILVIGILIAGVISTSALADTEITYPIASLGNCADKDACKVYCDKTENVDACLSYAGENKMMSTEEIDTAKNFKKEGFVGPGQCKGKDACYTYCSSTDKMDECVNFAEKKGLIKGDNLEKIKGKAQKVKEAIAKGIKPPACSSPEECSSYCKETAHMEECINFAKEAGMMDEQELENADKVLSAIKDGATPPACAGKDECDTYCSEATHMEECLTFAMKAGIITGEEKGQAQKTINAIKNGINPPNCKGQEECKTYCAEEANLEECVTFAEATGKITKEKADMIRSTGGKGFGEGGDGQGQINEQLQPWADMCQPDGNGNPTELACADDAGGFVTDAKIGEDKQPVCPTGSTAKCGNYPQIHQKGNQQSNQQGQNQQNKNQQDKNQQNQQGQSGDKKQGGSNQGGGQGPGGQGGGPGGCKGTEECQKYCASNPEVCKNFQPQNGQGQPNQPSQRQPQQQPGQPDQGVTNVGPCGTGPGTCSGIGPDDINPQNQPGQMQPQQ